MRIAGAVSSGGRPAAIMASHFRGRMDLPKRKKKKPHLGPAEINETELDNKNPHTQLPLHLAFKFPWLGCDADARFEDAHAHGEVPGRAQRHFVPAHNGPASPCLPSAFNRRTMAL